MKKLFALLVFLSLEASALLTCTGTTRSEMFVPAVAEDGSGIGLVLESEVRQGQGRVYIATTPLAGMIAQESENDAVTVAMEETGTNQSTCDVLFALKESGSAQTVDGPSAGGAMTLLTMAGLMKKSPRADVTISATIMPDGSLGPVGGMVAKAQAAKKVGIDTLLVSKKGSEDKFLLYAFARKSQMQVVEVENAQQAAQIIFSGKKYGGGTRMEFKADPFPDISGLEAKNASGWSEFSQSVQKLAERLERQVRQNDLGEAKGFFETKLGFSKKALEKGFLYTSGNEAFLAVISARFLNESMTETEEGMAERAKLKCLEEIQWKNFTRDNFQLLAGAQTRAGWSEKKLEETEIGKSEDEHLEALGEIIFAEEWCQTARELNQLAGGGRQADQDRWEPIARREISEASAALSLANDSEKQAFETEAWHLESAEAFYTEKKFAAAAFDAAYAKSMTVAVLKTGSDEQARKEADAAAGGNFDSLWGNVYSDHARYYLLKNGSAADAWTALKLLAYAQELETITRQMKQALELPQVAGSQALNESAGRNATVAGQEQGAKNAAQGAQVEGGKLLSIAVLIAIVVFALATALKKKEPEKGKLAARKKRKNPI